MLLDVSELEVDRINLEVNGLKAHVSVLAELASLVSLQIGVDARLDGVKLEIEGVRAKLLLKVRLDNVRAILTHALNTVAEFPEILRSLTRALDELLTGRLGDALGTLESVLGGLEEGGTVDEVLKVRLDDVRATLQEVLSQAGDHAEGAGTSPALPKRPAAGGPSGEPAEEKQGGILRCERLEGKAPASGRFSPIGVSLLAPLHLLRNIVGVVEGVGARVPCLLHQLPRGVVALGVNPYCRDGV